MNAMDEFFRQRDEISIKKERGDRLRISNTDGSPCNIHPEGSAYKIDEDAVNRIEKFIEILANLTKWHYKNNSWSWTNLTLYSFTKQSFDKDGLGLNGQNYRNLLERNPLNWAMTGKGNLEYTLEEPGTMT